MKELLLCILLLPAVLAVTGPEQIHIALGKDATSMVINWVTQDPGKLCFYKTVTVTVIILLY